jgi:hypothetical protein
MAKTEHEEFYDLFYSPSIVRVMKLRRLKERGT